MSHQFDFPLSRIQNIAVATAMPHTMERSTVEEGGGEETAS